MYRSSKSLYSEMPVWWWVEQGSLCVVRTGCALLLLSAQRQPDALKLTDLTPYVFLWLCTLWLLGNLPLEGCIYNPSFLSTFFHWAHKYFLFWNRKKRTFNIHSPVLSRNPEHCSWLQNKVLEVFPCLPPAAHCGHNLIQPLTKSRWREGDA